ncbi:putative WRKY transcription factor 51 [Carex littledalei]|uniref:Putative WRKY transcription factor 51 n=1 Tax=Carex littledalei TaxID=544730 RepID=A0A833VM67_9POAL|nr:putative WRKY transcription factor 51 [Carex littledalei]
MAAVGELHQLHYTDMNSYFLNHGNSSGSGCESGSASSSFGTGLTGDVNSDQPLPFDPSEYLRDDLSTHSAFSQFMDNSLFQAVQSNGVNLPVDGGNSCVSKITGMNKPRTERIAFRMKSEVEIIDDGFKWRKYGKKSVKNSPNPRNYYKCSTEGCSVKKRVEKEKDDPSYVITTYEGIHNHVSPSMVYYTSQDAGSGQYYVSGYQISPGSEFARC